MNIQELIQEVRTLNQHDKLRVLRELVDSLAPEGEMETEAKWWSPQVADPEDMAFLVELEQVLLTKGLDEANKMLTRKGESTDAKQP